MAEDELPKGLCEFLDASRPAPARAVTPTPEQAAVIAFGDAPTGDLLCYACAGGGKTETVCRAISRLVRRSGEPEEILLTTFSKRGQIDMQRRLTKHGAGAVSARTLHAVGLGLVQSMPIVEDREIQRVADWASKQIIKRELGRRASNLKPRMVAQEIGLAKASLVWPDEWADSSGKRWPGYIGWATSRRREPLGPSTAKTVDAIYRELETVFARPEKAFAWDRKRMTFYDQPFFKNLGPEPAARRRGCTHVRFVTWDDMIALAVRAARTDPEFARAHKGSYEWVWVDETQDSTFAQWELARFLKRRHLVVVGDDAQAVFSFCGARPELMHTFASEPGVRVLPLSVSFRCGKEIVDAANGLLSCMGERLWKGAMVSGRGTPAVVTHALDPTPEHEARRVVAEIATALAAGAKPEGLAVLYRLNAQAGPLEMAAIQASLPYQVAGRSFFNRPEIAAALGYVACALDETDGAGWLACANVPNRFLGAVFFAEVPSMKVGAHKAMRGELHGSGRGPWARGVAEALAAIQAVRTRLSSPGGAAAAFRFVFEKLGVRAHFRDEDADDDTETEVDAACAAMTDCAAGGDAAKVLGYARSMAHVGREDADGKAGLARVTLSTVHRSKGLEYDRVWAIGLNQGTFPLARADIEEERRIAYVCISRARDVVTISSTAVRSGGTAAAPSQFIAEMGLCPAAADEDDDEGGHSSEPDDWDGDAPEAFDEEDEEDEEDREALEAEQRAQEEQQRG